MNERPVDQAFGPTSGQPIPGGDTVVGQLAGSVAHELSRPLATILASSQSLLAMLPDDTLRDPHALPAEYIRDDIRHITEQAQRATELIGSLLAMAHRRPLEDRLFWLTDVVRRVATLAEGHLALCDIHLEAPVLNDAEAKPDWCCLRGDAIQLQQLLLGLIIDAQQAIRAQRPHGRIRLSLAPQSGAPTEPRLVTVVIDDDRPQAPSGRGQHGLAIPRAAHDSAAGGDEAFTGDDVIRRHRGTTRVETSPWGGARLVLTFPVAAPARVSGETVAPAAGHRERVLLLDDDPGVRSSISRYLTRYGFSVTTAGSGEDAIAQLETTPVDVVVTDINMPGMSGEVFFDRVTECHPELSHRIIFFSGDLSHPDTLALLENSGCPALQKPFDLSDLSALIERVGRDAKKIPIVRAG